MTQPQSDSSALRIQRLNMDNSWYLQLGGLRVLVDPWLEGVEVDYFPLFNTQWHRTPPLPYAEVPAFDAVLITQKYPDHFHLKTLKALSPSLVFAPASLGKKLAKHLPEATIHTFDRNHPVRNHQGVRITWLPTPRKIDPIYDAWTLDDGNESVFLATHGFQLTTAHHETLQGVSACSLLVVPLNDYQLPALLGGAITPGLEVLQQLVADLKPRFIVRTHDEDKHATGLVTRLSRIKVLTEESIPQLKWLHSRYLPTPDYTPHELLNPARV